MSASTIERRPTVAWVDAMTARRREAHGARGLQQYRHALLVKHGLPTRAREQGPLWKTGRSPAGNLRNFAAMTDAKFVAVYVAVTVREQNDDEAIEAVEAELARRS